ncbi:S9 family peptidase [Spirosoma flavum]|uniref:Prolyl oligopeptidase family serine peptidase n=1 Tax=Spirosoma flavum TaxID=2048557 RepID=A0ABW6AF65_9BACT
MKKQLLLYLVCSSLSGSVIAQSSWTPASMIAYKRVSSPFVSPDGKLVAYVVATARMDAENSDFLSQIYVASSDGKTNHQYTFGDKSCTDPQFSPDGQFMAFTSGRGKDKDAKKQLYVMRLTGGEAEPVTVAKNNITTYAWSPDSKRIAYIVTDARSTQDEKDRKEKKDWDVVDQFQNAHLYALTLTKNAKGDYPVKQLTKGAFHLSGLDWSPNSKTIVFSQQNTPSVNDWVSSKIATVSADSGAVQSLALDKGAASQPIYSHDGRFIAYVADVGQNSWMYKKNICLIPAGGGPVKRLASTPDEQPILTGWSPDDKAVVVSEALHTASAMYSLPADGSALKKLTPLTQGIYASPHLNNRGDVALLYQTTDMPVDVYIASLSNMTARKLTNIHADYMAGKKVAKTDVLTWKSKDGKYDIDGLLTYPANYQAGKKYPLILNVHGGPAGVFAQTYTGASSPYPIQAFAQEGYFVLRPNPRGSSGYGTEFRKANYRDWGNNDYEDLMVGVDKTIQMGLAHPDSLVETGWSYGGYMTSTIITKTNRFKAVMAGAPVTNLMSFNGTADIADFLPSYFGGEFWDDPKVYADHSPMFAIKNAKTPTLIIHGQSDDRVPPEQGYQLHRALQRLGVKTKMITYPRQPHGFVEPKFIQDVGERVLDWFDSNLNRHTETAHQTASVLSEGKR